ncbi:MAG: hypothetical protein ABS911_03235 [Carnobacterium sp.]|uniref:hypothetical protein n=1 Tax=Carnobacterium sp. TaxID=48221 RepID=UPI00331632F7
MIHGKYQTIKLDVEESDVLINADGVLDCPIDTVLRKNKYTFEDLNNWLAKEVQFIVEHNGSESVINTIPLDVNL